MTDLVPVDDESIALAARLILGGEPVAVPTETVYGLAADATNPRAVARIYEAKGRPTFNPLIVHVPDLASAERIGRFGPSARMLAEQHWPGPLTLVVPLTDGEPVAALVTAGLATVALRVPAHPAMRALLAATARPLAAPSANRSGAISPTLAEHVLGSLGGRIPLILDGGACERGLESTIVAVTASGLRLLRAGPVLVDAPPASGERIEAPGQLASHYAPSKALRTDAERRREDEYLIGFGAIDGDLNLSPSGNLVEAAANLFAALHLADAASQPRIAVASIPAHGLGGAINDRLRRAAAPRQ